MKTREFTMLHFFCGAGGKGYGAKRARATFGEHAAMFRTIGGIDIDRLACKDFEMLVGAPTLCLDVHKLEPEQLRQFAGRTAPDAIMMSPPCKGFSGLLSAKRALEEKYQEMNRLMLRSLFLVSATWSTPPKIVFVENVPRIASRGKDMVRQAKALLEAHGYAVTIGTHDCGELGGLAQHRRRWFMLARHREQVPQFVYEPPKHRVRACGEVLGPMPMPGDIVAGGPMHSLPRLSWRNWLRLALIPAGGDWRDLPGTLEEGQKRREKFRRLPVTGWESTAETITGPGGSASANIADERARAWFPSAYRVSKWDAEAPTVTSGGHPSTGAGVVADPRFADGKKKNWQQVAGVTAWTSPAPTVTSGAKIHAGAFQVADPRIPNGRVMTLAQALELDLPPNRWPGFVPIIIAADGTWHRPLTTYELAALQSLPIIFNGAPLVLAGTSHTRWREAIGNLVPPDAALAIANQIVRALLIAAVGGFALASTPIWVAPERRAMVV